MLFQTCMTFFLQWNTKEDILKNVDNQNVGKYIVLVQFDFYYMDKKNKKFLLCSTEEKKSYRLAKSWGWVNYDRIFIFGWTIPLQVDVLL